MFYTWISDGDIVVTENFIQKSLRIRLMRIKYRNPKRIKEEKKAGKMPFICCFLRQTLVIKNAFPNSLLKFFRKIPKDLWRSEQVFTSNPQRSSTILQRPLKFLPTLCKVFAGCCKDLVRRILQRSWRILKDFPEIMHRILHSSLRILLFWAHKTHRIFQESWKILQIPTKSC